MTEPQVPAIGRRPAVRPIESVAEKYRDKIATMADKIELVTEAIKFMSPGIDYGIIPGTTSPTLFKPGAEKLRLLFGFEIEYVLTDLCRTEEAIYRYRIGVLGFTTIKDDMGLPLRMKVGEGLGTASSLENKYQFRWLTKSALPKEYKDMDYNAATEKWKLLNGEESVKWVGKPPKKYPKFRIVNTNPADIDNTVLKISKKRAFVDFINLATGCASVFQNAALLANAKITAPVVEGYDEIEETEYVDVSSGEIKETAEVAQVTKEIIEIKTKKPPQIPQGDPPNQVEDPAGSREYWLLKAGINNNTKYVAFMSENFPGKTWGKMSAKDKQEVIDRLKAIASLPNNK